MDGEQNLPAHLEPDGSVSYGAPTDAFGVEQRDPNADYELTDEFGNAIDAEVQEQFAPYAPEECEDLEPGEISMEDAVGDAIRETVVMPDQEEAFNDLLDARPNIASSATMESIGPVVEAIAGEYGIAAAIHPDTIEAVYEQLGGDEVFGGPAEDERARAGIMAHAKVDPATGKRRDIFT